MDLSEILAGGQPINNEDEEAYEAEEDEVEEADEEAEEEALVVPAKTTRSGRTIRRPAYLDE